MVRAHKTGYRWFLGALLVWCVWTSSALAQPRSHTPLVSAVESVGMTVSDLDRSVAFYTTVLTFRQISGVIDVRGDTHAHLPGIRGFRKLVVRLRLGEEILELTEYVTPPGRPFPNDSQSNDRWFQHIAIIVSDMEAVHDRLRSYDVEFASRGPQRLPDWNEAVAGIEALYFRDPDGHFLEVLYFPPGKGSPKWHIAIDQLFLGIDHTAIVVADTETSLQFYRDTLGLRIVGESDNFGAEQAALNNVARAHLRITTLQAASGPGIELLEYREPRYGRPMPPDASASDLLYWQTRLVTDMTETAFERLRTGFATFLSLGTVMRFSEGVGFTRELFVRDPDGHAIQLVER